MVREPAGDALRARLVSEVEQQLGDAAVHVEQHEATHLFVHAAQPAGQLPQQGERDPRCLREDALEVLAPQYEQGESSMAMTCAERGSSSTRAISPKNSPS